MASGNSMREVCRFFATPRGCRYGEACRFLHSSEYVAQPKFPQICRYFNTPSGCRYGSSCRFQHEVFGLPLQFNRTVPKPRTSQFDDQDQEAEFNTRKAELEDILCGECGELVKKTEQSSAAVLLKDHYIEKLSNCDEKHIVYFKECDEFIVFDFECSACKQTFDEGDITHLLKHLAKSIRKNKKKLKHKEQLERIAMAFVDRDCESAIKKNKETSEKEKITEPTPNQASAEPAESAAECNNNVKPCSKATAGDSPSNVKDQKEEENLKIAAFGQLAVVAASGAEDNCDVNTGGDSDEYETCSDEDANGNPCGLMIPNPFKKVDTFTRRLLDATCDPREVVAMTDELEEFGDDDKLALMLHSMVRGGLGGDSDEDSEEEQRMRNCGFTDEDVFELACQGIRPWDPEAWGAMAILNGDDDYW